MKSMLKDAMILFLITVLAGGILGAVYQITKEPIAKQEEKAKKEAYQEVFATADSFEATEKISVEKATKYVRENGFSGQSFDDEIMEAKDSSGNLLGYVLTVVTSEGYGGNITFAMGISLDGTLNGISLLSISETPGLGMEAESVLVPQFKEKTVPQFEYTKSGAVSDSQIDAISGATITTNAIVNGVNSGLSLFRDVLKEGGSSNE